MTYWTLLVSRTHQTEDPRFAKNYTVIALLEDQKSLVSVLCVNVISLCFLGPESHCQTVLHQNTTRPQSKMNKGEKETKTTKCELQTQNHPLPVTTEHHTRKRRGEKVQLVVL